jgi:hypothetical protein
VTKSQKILAAMQFFVMIPIGFSENRFRFNDYLFVGTTLFSPNDAFRWDWDWKDIEKIAHIHFK